MENDDWQSLESKYSDHDILELLKEQYLAKEKVAVLCGTTLHTLSNLVIFLAVKLNDYIQ